MTDRELLELAAKAAGYEFGVLNDKPKIKRDGVGTCGTWGCGRHNLHDWNPLEDDGDALRLAVKLGILVDLRYTSPETARYNSVTYWPNPMKGERIEFGDREMDPYAATRRAIVRAAAEIGRTK